MPSADDDKARPLFAVLAPDFVAQPDVTAAVGGSAVSIPDGLTAAAKSSFGDAGDGDLRLRVSPQDQQGAPAPSDASAAAGNRFDGTFAASAASTASGTVFQGIPEPAGSASSTGSSFGAAAGAGAGSTQSGAGYNADIFVGEGGSAAPQNAGGTVYEQTGPVDGSALVSAPAADSAGGAAHGGSSGSGSSGVQSFSAAGAASQHLVINLSYDSSVNSAPAAFKTELNAVVQFFENTFTNPITLTIAVGYGEIEGYSLGGALGESAAYLYGYSYSQIANAMRAGADTANAATAAASLPASDPTHGGQFWVTEAEAQALGLPGYFQGLDGYVGFSSAYGFDYDNSNGVSPGQYDFFGVVAHELSEVLGRQMMDGASNSYEPLDLFHYSASGVRSFVGTTPGYFSINGGVTDLANFNTNPGGDFGDWASSAGNDAFLAYSPSGVVDAVSSADITELNALGWKLVATPPPQARAVSDFNGDGTSDILWRNASAAGIDLMSNGTVSAWTTLGTIASNWSVLGVGDFNGDGTSDILWRNATSGATGIDLMRNGTVAGWTSLGTITSDWSVLGIGDLTGDGTADILWRNTSGQTGIDVMRNGTAASWTGLGTISSTWQVQGIGDFNGDGTADILWRDSSGAAGIDLMKNGAATAWVNLGTISSAWQVLGVGDFNADGTADILFRNATTGDTGVELMKNGTANAWSALGVTDSSWSVAQIGDFNGDGTADILWRNSNGSTGVDLMKNAVVATWSNFSTITSDWSIAQPGPALSSA